MTDFIIYVILSAGSGVIQDLILRYTDKLGYKANGITRYPAIFATGMINSFLHYKYGTGYTFIIYALLTEILVAITVVDLNHKIILNRFNVTIGALGVINMIMAKSYYDSIIAFALAGGLFLALALISNGGIGGGDIKMIAPLGLLFGVLPTAYIVCYTFVIGAVFCIALVLLKKKTWLSEIALAPYISLATLLFITYFV
jgi:leader peptidase (prepilin peptidase)/N-methyltransferase